MKGIKQTISTIAKDNKTVGFYHKNKPYVIGFRNAHVARKVMYTMHPEPVFSLITSNPVKINDEHSGLDILIDSEATLFIPKSEYKQFTLPDYNLYYIDPVDYDTFTTYPYTKNIGIILPYVLMDETEEELVYRSHMVLPVYTSYLRM